MRGFSNACDNVLYEFEYEIISEFITKKIYYAIKFY